MRELKEHVSRIRELLPQEEILAQLAEECAELGQAALKYRRVLDGTNPTPVEHDQAVINLYEELGDVIGCLFAADLVHHIDQECVDFVSAFKMERWVRRLEARHGAE